MSDGISRRVFLGSVAAAAAAPVFAGAPQKSPFPIPRPGGLTHAAVPAPDTLLARAGLGGKVGYVVADARSGAVLETMNPLLSLPPASVAKAVTSVYALSELGSDHRFRTRLVATGPVVEGRIQGDLVLAGGGDPVLDTDDLAGLAKALKAAGVRGVTGRFLVWAGALPYQRQIDPGQPDQLGYNPAVSGLNLNFNRVHFQWQRQGGGYAVTMDARSDSYRPDVTIARMEVVNRDLPVYTYRQDGVLDRWTVAQSALGDAGSRWLPVRRPDLYTAETFQVLARGYGISLPKAEPVDRLPAGTALVSHDSAALGMVVQLMLKYSTNLTAEVIGLAASHARGRHPHTLKASAAAMNSWMRATLGTKHARLVDHSGLSDASRLSPSDMVKALVKVGHHGVLPGLMKEVIPLDLNGKPDEHAPYAIRAKTGSLNFVSSLAGYATAADGRELAFAVFTGDLPRRAKLTRGERERPDGARDWGKRSRWLQHRLIARWVALYGAG